MICAVAQRWRCGRASYRPAGELFAPLAHEVAEIDRDGPAREFVEAHHYSGTYPAARRRFGLYRGAALVGVAVFSVPMTAAVLGPLPAGAEAAELGRFVLLDEVPGNGESWFLARCLDVLRREGWAGVVTFADPEARTTASGESVFGGHLGTIYQASNAVYLGRATPRTLRVLPDGTVFSARAAQKIRARERGWRYAVEQLVAAGAPEPANDDLRGWLPVALAATTRTVRHRGNHKYVIGLESRVRAMLPASRSYPKVEARRCCVADLAQTSRNR